MAQGFPSSAAELLDPLARFALLSPLPADPLTEGWRARRDDGQPVTLRVLRPALRDDRQLRRLFVEDLSLAIHLDHPGFVRILEFGSTFVALAPVPGPTLRTVLERTRRERRPLPSWFPPRVALEAARALHHAHSLTDERGEPLGILHGGLRPEALAVGARGVKVLDLGLARATALAPEAWEDGRLAYLAPEQVRGGCPDVRADLYSLALCLLESATGANPRRGADDRELLRKVAAGELPSLRATGLGGPLAAVLERALDPDPARRFADLGSFAAALSALPEAEASAKQLSALIEELFPEEPVDSTPEPEDAGEELARELTPVRLVARSGVHRQVAPSPSAVERTTPIARLQLGDEVARAAAARFDRGLELLLGGSYELALAEWEQAVALTPQNRLYASNLARLRSLTRERA